jgi:anti-anti-sigma regulatory factor
VPGTEASPRSVAPEAPSAPRTERPRERTRTGAVVTLHVGGLSPESLESRLSEALDRAGVTAVVVDFDSAEFVEDRASRVLHKGLTHADARGVRLELRASRPGAQRWLRRHRLPGGEP